MSGLNLSKAPNCSPMAAPIVVKGRTAPAPIAAAVPPTLATCGLINSGIGFLYVLAS